MVTDTDERPPAHSLTDSFPPVLPASVPRRTRSGPSTAPLVPLCRSILLGLFVALLAACGPSDQTNTNVEPPPSHLDSLAATAAPTPDQGPPTKRVRGQTLYVPAYSHIYIRDAQRSMNLATTLSIRNTSLDTPLRLSSIDYYDSSGERVRSYLDTTRTLDPLGSTYVVVETDDIRGGVGANFIVRWHARTPIPPPVVETVMITSASTLGISFRSPARVLYEEPAGDGPAPSDPRNSSGP